MKKIIKTLIFLNLTSALIAQTATEPVKKEAAAETKPETPSETKASGENKPAAIPAPGQAEQKKETPAAESKIPEAEMKKPGETPAVKEPELDEETKRQIEEAKQKILREKAARLEAEKRARDEAEKKRLEEEASFFVFFKKNSKLWFGLTGGIGISLNQIHGAGGNFGGFAEYRFLDHYGLRIGAETGVWSAKDFTFESGNGTYFLPLDAGGRFGFLKVSPSVQYALPKFSPLDLSVGAGITIYQLNAGNSSIGFIIAPIVNLSAFYTVWRGLDIGTIFEIGFASTQEIRRENVPYTLDSRESLLNLNLQLSLRYAIF